MVCKFLSRRYEEVMVGVVKEYLKCSLRGEYIPPKYCLKCKHIQ